MTVLHKIIGGGGTSLLMLASHLRAIYIFSHGIHLDTKSTAETDTVVPPPRL